MTSGDTDTEPLAREAIDEALAATGILPPYERLVELDELLRAELQRLMPLVQRHTDTLWRGGTDWYGHTTILAGARHALDGDLGAGLRSAATQVHTLARHCLWLTQTMEGAR